MAETQDWFSANAPKEPLPIARDERGMPRVSSNLSDGKPSDLEQALGPFAHPQTLTDFAKLLTLPVDEVRKAMASVLLVNAAKRTPAAISDAASAMADGVKDIASRTSVNPSAVLDFKINQPLQFLKKVVSVAPKGSAAQSAAPAGVETAQQALARMTAASATTVPPTIGEAAEAAPAAAAAPPVTPAEAVQAVATPAEAAPAWTPTKIRLTADESKVAAELIRRGKTDAEVEQAIQAARELRKRFGSPSDAAARAAIRLRNLKG